MTTLFNQKLLTFCFGCRLAQRIEIRTCTVELLIYFFKLATSNQHVLELIFTYFPITSDRFEPDIHQIRLSKLITDDSSITSSIDNSLTFLGFSWFSHPYFEHWLCLRISVEFEMDSIASAFSLYKLLETVVVDFQSSCKQPPFELISIIGVVYGRHTRITFFYP